MGFVRDEDPQEVDRVRRMILLKRFFFWLRIALTYLTFNSLKSPTEVVKQIIINIEAGVEVEVTIAA